MMFKAKTPRFFKIILHHNIGEGKQLDIPRKFLRRYGNYLSSKVFLKVPSGSKWQVDLIKHGDHVCFGNGWQQFVDYYSLSYGSFLVFGFENLKISSFDVIIFDKSASEIDYPFNEEEPQLVIPEIVEIDDSPPRNSRKTSPLPSSRPCKKIKLENHTQLPDEDASFVKRTQTSTAEEKANAINRENNHYNSNNLSFSIPMRSSYVGGHYRAVVPATATKYFKQERGNIVLSTIDKRSWAVEHISIKTSRYNTVRLCGGWREFVEDNDLVVGDVCVFQVLNHNATELKVIIHRENQEAKSGTTVVEVDSFVKRTQALTAGESANAIIRANRRNKSNYSSFCIAMCPTYFRGNYRAVIPARGKKYFQKERGNIILNTVGKRSWSVEYVRKKRKSL